MIVSCVRAIIMYLIITIALRIMGKRQLGELEPSELVITILISEIISVPMQDMNIPLLYGIAPVVILICLEVLFSAGLFKSLRFRQFFCGRPCLLIENGVILEKELRRNRILLDELLEELRVKDITDLHTVQYAILETSGKLSALLYPAEQPATAAQVGASPARAGLPVVVINDGREMSENIKLRGLTKEFLTLAMKSYGVDSPQDVLLMTVDEQGKVFLIPKAASI